MIGNEQVYLRLRSQTIPSLTIASLLVAAFALTSSGRTASASPFPKLAKLPANAWPSPTGTPAYVPGKSLDKIRIGETRKEVLMSVGRKPDAGFTDADGTIEDVWNTTYTASNGDVESRAITVYFQSGRVFMIDLNVGDPTKSNLPTFGELIEKNNSLKKIVYRLQTIGDSGQPIGSGSTQFYFYDNNRGVVYGLDLTDEDFLLNDYPADAVVFKPGASNAMRILMEVEASIDKITIETGFRAQVFKNQADADKARKLAGH